MKLFLDTADVTAIETLCKTGLVDGVTTNPTHLYTAGGNPVEIVKQICALLPNGEISVEVTQKDPQELYKQAKSIAAIAPNIVVKIPCHAAYYQVIKQLVYDDIAVNVTLVFSLLQAVYMAKLGVEFVSPFVGRLDDIDSDGMDLIHQLKEAFLQHGFETQILAASIRHIRHLHDAVLSGVDAVTIPPSLFLKSMEHPLTDAGIALFDTDWKKLGNSQFP